MCGIAGIINTKQAMNEGEYHAALRAMSSSLKHRGPDSNGMWVDSKAGVGLSHRRLAIIDVSPSGNQPMVSSSGRFILTYNGEVYNFLQLRADLISSGAVFRGRSDTEVLLAAIECWGLSSALDKILGMFAFAVWDRSKRKLFLARDRMGEKPLYYGYCHGEIRFGSELKAVTAGLAIKPDINKSALKLYMQHGYVPAPYTIYENIYKLEPGNILELDKDSYINRPTQKPYWSYLSMVENHTVAPLHQSPSTYVDELESILLSTINDQMISDVPCGALLSGGVDSSLVVALMQQQSDQPVKTFTVGFSEHDYDEAKQAGKVAKHLKTDHTEVYVGPEHALEVIPNIHEIYDEPFADASQIPTYLISKIARQKVTVALSGDGGDEMFGGYNRYVYGCAHWQRFKHLPLPMRQAMSVLLNTVSPSTWESVYRVIESWVPGKYRVNNIGNKIHKLADIIALNDPVDIYFRLVSQWNDSQKLVMASSSTDNPIGRADNLFSDRDFREAMMHADAATYLPNDVLTKVDRASMSASLEVRAPFLDRRVVEQAWKIPVTIKFQDGSGKWPLRQLLYRYLPGSLVDRPKMGFSVPIDAWLRGPLRDWAASLLDREELRSQGILDADLVSAKWDEHLSGRKNWQYHLWNVLMFQQWYENSEVKL